MTPKLRPLGFVMAGCGIFVFLACNQNEDKRNCCGPISQGTGSAHIRLPSVPAGYLAKTAAGAKAQALFALTIYGNDMAPMRLSWLLTPGNAQSADIPGIPAGYPRIFEGRLIRLDSAGDDTTATHEGSDTVAIRTDSVAQVNLFLRKTGGGSAHVCVDVEGWPNDSACILPPILIPHSAQFGGCWNLSVTKPGAAKRQDSSFHAKLRIQQWDTNLVAILTWNSGARDTTFGYVAGNGSAHIGYSGGEFRINAMLDTNLVDTTFNKSFRGTFNDSLRSIYGTLFGKEAPCDTAPNYPSADSVFGFRPD